MFWASLVVVIAYPPLDGADVCSMRDLRQVLCMFDRVVLVGIAFCLGCSSECSSAVLLVYTLSRRWLVPSVSF